MEMRSAVQTGVKVTPRLKTLYYFVYEMADAFGVDKYGLNTITKGILERKIVKQITANYHNNNDEIVGRVTIDIDWETHEFLAATDYGRTFRLDPQKPVRRQITELSDIIIDHVNKLRDEYGVTRISTHYRYIQEIESNPSQNAEAMEFLGHTYSKIQVEKIEPVFNQTLSFLIDQLRELKITVSNK